VANLCVGQNISYTELKTGITNSLYDAEMISNDSLLAVGKNGQILILSNNKINSEIKCCSNFYKIIKTNGVPILSSDSGCIYFLEKNIHFDYKFKNSIYSGIWYHDKLFYSTVKKKIASGLKAIPNGTLTTETLKNTKHFKGSVIWDLQNLNDTLTALKYNIFGTRILKFINNKWCKKNYYNALLHSTCLGADGSYYAGTNNFKRKNAIIISPNKKFIFKNEGVVWDIKNMGNYIIASGSNGLIYYKKNEDLVFAKLQLPTKMNMYDITIKNDKEFFVVGQNGVMYLLKL
jgi:hypothetical protein